MTRTINYHYFHWGPFLYKSSMSEEEIKKIKKLCSKKSEDYRINLAGLLKHEHKLDVKEIFPIIFPYINSYMQAYIDYRGNKDMATNPEIELKASWVNYMTKFESNPLHTHDDDLSFVIYTEISKNLKKEVENTVGNTRPGWINFMYTLGEEKYHINKHIFMPEIGDIFIFPATLHHSVNHFQSEGERVSVSGNLKITNG